MDMLTNKIINSQIAKYDDLKTLLPKKNDDSVESQKSSIAAEKMVFGGKNGKLPIFSPAERAKECYIYQINMLNLKNSSHWKLQSVTFKSENG